MLYEVITKRMDGTICWIKDIVSVENGDKGQPKKLFGYMVDISDQKQAEEELAQSEKWHQTILSTALGGVWTVDLHGNFLEANEAYCTMSGYRSDELRTMSIAVVEALESEKEVLHHIQEIVRVGKAKFESRHRRKDGTVFDVDVSAKYLPVGAGRIVAMSYNFV